MAAIDKICVVGKIMQESHESNRINCEDLKQYHIATCSDNSEPEHDYFKKGTIHGSVQFIQSGLDDYMFYINFIEYTHETVSRYNFDENEKHMKKFVTGKTTARDYWLKRTSFEWYSLLYCSSYIEIPGREKSILKSFFKVLYCMYEMQLIYTRASVNLNRWKTKWERGQKTLDNAALSINMQYRIYNQVLFEVISSIDRLYHEKQHVSWDDYGLGYLIDNIWKRVSRTGSKVFSFLTQYENVFDLDENGVEKKFDFIHINFDSQSIKYPYSLMKPVTVKRQYLAYLNMRYYDLYDNRVRVYRYVRNQLKNAKLTGACDCGVPRISYEKEDDD